MRILTVIVVYIAFILGRVVCIDLSDGKYRNVYIFIQDTVAENEILIERIKSIFTNASRLLFEATRHQVHFGEINILIPNTWKSKPEYEKIPAMSDFHPYITVDEGNVKAPHTKRRENKCGSPGWYMYLPASFVLEEGKTEYGYHGKVVVREWGHLRWGHWDEYANKKYGQFYLQDGEWKPVRCSKSVSGKVGRGFGCIPDTLRCNISDTDRVMNDTCNFCPDEIQSVSNMSSIMAFNRLDAVATFCESKNDARVPVHQKHNNNGWSKQNVNCYGQSSWEVMREHEDFKSETTLPASTNTAPTFRILHETERHHMLVIDVSGSMNNMINQLYKESAYIIQAKIPDNSWLGIVWFESKAQIKKDLTQITSQQIRHELEAALPQTTLGGTCVACGIDTAIDHLKEKVGHLHGSEITVITDAIGVPIQNASDIGLTIHAISVSSSWNNNQMIPMAVATGCKHFTVLRNGAISFAEALTEIMLNSATSFASQTLSIVSEVFNTISSGIIHTNFNIDSSIGKTTSVSVLQNTHAYLKVYVFSPNGKTYITDTSMNIISLDLPGRTVVGLYNITIETNSSSLELHITSSPIDFEAVQVSAWIYPLYFNHSSGELPVVVADVSKGRAAVVDADVTAIIESSRNPFQCTLALLDNGADPDDTAGDGVYAAVIPTFCIVGNGRVSGKVNVKGENGVAYVIDLYSTAESTDSDMDDGNGIDTFQRSVVTNDIEVHNYFKADLTTPGRITDVTIIDVSVYGSRRIYTITWTATGDDVNIGQAKEYEFSISNNNNLVANDLTNANLQKISRANFTPSAASMTECIKIEVDTIETLTSTAYFAVRAKDEAANIGFISNIISILVGKSYDIRILNCSSIPITEKDTRNQDNLNLLVIGLASAGAVIVVAIVIFSLLVKNAKSRVRVKDSEYGSELSIEKGLEFDLTISEKRTTVPKKIFEISQLEAREEQTWTALFTSNPNIIGKDPGGLCQQFSGDDKFSDKDQESVNADKNTRPTVPKKVFISSQLESFQDREQNWFSVFSPKHVSNIFDDKIKPFYLLNQIITSSMDTHGEHNSVSSEHSLESETKSLSSESPQRDIEDSFEDMDTIRNIEDDSDILQGEGSVHTISKSILINEKYEK